MKLIVGIFVLLQFAVINRVSSQRLIPSMDILSKVYLIKFEFYSGVGSCFVVYHKGHEYVITAKHNLLANGRGVESGTVVNFDVGSKLGWNRYTGILQVHKNENIDIVAIKRGLSENSNPFEISSDFTMLFDDAIMLGYPFGYSMEESNNSNLLPFAKKGIISGVLKIDSVDYFVIDALNNKGFSGGPVFIEQNNILKLIGVVKGYIQSNHYFGEYMFT